MSYEPSPASMRGANAVREVLGLFHNPWRAEYAPPGSIPELYRRAVWIKANPRGAEYMKALFLERYPHGTFVDSDSDSSWRERLRSADTVVLLYPDSIGLHFSALEAIVTRERKTGAAVRVLNGRRRDFVWNSRARRALRWRRFLERTMLGEVLATLLFAAVTPFLVLDDLVRKRR